MPFATAWECLMSLFDPAFTAGLAGLDLTSLANQQQTNNVALANQQQAGDPYQDQLNNAGGSLVDPVVETEQQTLIESSQSDTRIRLRCLRGEAIQNQIYGPKEDMNIMSILHDTDGMLFPYTPTVNVGQTTNYQNMSLIHTNGDIQSYSNTPSVTISVTGAFTVQNQREGRYLLACLHLLRTVSKMYFGEKDKKNGKAGMPPPIMVFTGYGNYMFNDLPVIVRGHSYTLDDSADTVVIETAGGVARLPSKLTLSLDLVVQQTPQRQRKTFSLDDFRTGALMRGSGGGTGWI